MQYLHVDEHWRATLLQLQAPVLQPLLHLQETIWKISSGAAFLVVRVVPHAWLDSSPKLMRKVHCLTTPVLAGKCGGSGTWQRPLLVVGGLVEI